MLRGQYAKFGVDEFFAPEALWMVAGGETTGQIRKPFRVPAGTPDVK